MQYIYQCMKSTRRPILKSFSYRPFTISQRAYISANYIYQLVLLLVTPIYLFIWLTGLNLALLKIQSVLEEPNVARKVQFFLLLFLEKDEAHAHESRESSMENHGLFLGMHASGQPARVLSLTQGRKASRLTHAVEITASGI